MDLEKIGKRVKQCRNLKKMTQEELAENINVSPHYVYEIERGVKTMSLYVLGRVSEALDVSVDYLLFGEDSSSLVPRDNLKLLIDSLDYEKRIVVAKILENIIPHLK